MRFLPLLGHQDPLCKIRNGDVGSRKVSLCFLLVTLQGECEVYGAGPWVAQSLLKNEADPGDMTVIDLSRLSQKGKL